MKRTPLKRLTPLARSNTPLKRGKGLAPVSVSRKGGLALYRINRREYLEANPLCKWPECDCKAVELHHSRGRIGSLLWDATWFRGLCTAHHRRAHDYPNEGKEMGVSFDRLGVIEP